MSDKKSNIRTRNYATVVYPDSAPENWQEILVEHFVPAFISPLHDKDVNVTGEPKKSHWHVIIMFEGPKTQEQAESIFNTICGVGCERVNSIRGYSRYLCHLDNPEKSQYNVDDVRCLCGADFTSCIGLATDKYKAIREMMHYCIDNCIYSYSDLLLYCSEERSDWFRVLCDNGTVVIKEFLKSRSWTLQKSFVNNSLT